jgi:iduronate 2-sulfatase
MTPYITHRFLAVTLAFVAIPMLAYGQTNPSPNVLFIISDDLTAKALGSYGNVQCETPNIDRLASQGVRFTRTYCQFPICGPSRAAIMSSLYPQHTGIMSNGDAEKFEGVMGEKPSMAEHFRNNGYHTARVSKIYHMRVPGDITAGVDGPDHADSWDEKYNCQGPEWMTEGEHEHLTNERLRRDPDVHYSLGFGGAFYVVKGSSNGAEQPDVQAATKAIEILEERRDKPFFLAVGLVRPHVPLVAPESYFEPYPHSDMKLAERVENDWDDIPKKGISKNAKGIGLDGKPDAQRKVLAAYYASVSFMDAQVGRMLGALDRLDLRKNTIVVFMSDHGYHLGEHDFWQKVGLHEESTRIPMIIAGPGIAPGEATTLSEQIDLYPTLSQLAGLPIPGHVQGRSLVPALKDNRVAVRDSAYSVTRSGATLRTENWAYIRHSDGTTELYDMQGDSSQFTNLAGIRRYNDVLEGLESKRRAKVAEFALDSQND